MILFAYVLIAIFFLGFLTVVTWNEMSWLNVMVVCGLSIMWPITLILLVVRRNELKGGSE
ncbi:MULTISPECIES: hypothetical protein [unclassified Mesotoga]|uniref:hypothetical protein n=1 Tax=unclassified Mesotoga TaxID=1184398 RepID=UPI000DA64D11|nr:MULTISPECIES: hypothetical protein [unclassified Mesotoga]PZC51479.1 hypothetical protein LH53_10875 [Mesotoga sp. TolDC]